MESTLQGLRSGRRLLHLRRCSSAMSESLHSGTSFVMAKTIETAWALYGVIQFLGILPTQKRQPEPSKHDLPLALALAQPLSRGTVHTQLRLTPPPHLTPPSRLLFTSMQRLTPTLYNSAFSLSYSFYHLSLSLSKVLDFRKGLCNLLWRIASSGMSRPKSKRRTGR
jgi:hypothetical protein